MYQKIIFEITLHEISDKISLFFRVSLRQSLLTYRSDNLVPLWCAFHWSLLLYGSPTTRYSHQLLNIIWTICCKLLCKILMCTNSWIYWCCNLVNFYIKCHLVLNINFITADFLYLADQFSIMVVWSPVVMSLISIVESNPGWVTIYINHLINYIPKDDTGD